MPGPLESSTQPPADFVSGPWQHGGLGLAGFSNEFLRQLKDLTVQGLGLRHVGVSQQKKLAVQRLARSE